VKAFPRLLASYNAMQDLPNETAWNADSRWKLTREGKLSLVHRDGSLSFITSSEDMHSCRLPTQQKSLPSCSGSIDTGLHNSTILYYER
jgi:hypothetical protein